METISYLFAGSNSARFSMISVTAFEFSIGMEPNIGGSVHIKRGIARDVVLALYPEGVVVEDNHRRERRLKGERSIALRSVSQDSVIMIPMCVERTCVNHAHAKA